MWWLLAREVLRLRGTIPRTPDGWNVMVDMFFYRDPEEVEKQQQEEAAAKAQATAEEPAAAEWGAAAAPVGGIDPTLATEGGKHPFTRLARSCLTVSQVLTGLRSLLLQEQPTGQLSRPVLAGRTSPPARLAGNKRRGYTTRLHMLRRYCYVLLAPRLCMPFDLSYVQHMLKRDSMLARAKLHRISTGAGGGALSVYR